jgi:hypothetical protein
MAPMNFSGSPPGKIVRCTGRIQGATAALQKCMEASSRNSSRNRPVTRSAVEGDLETTAKAV